MSNDPRRLDTEEKIRDFIGSIGTGNKDYNTGGVVSNNNDNAALLAALAALNNITTIQPNDPGSSGGSGNTVVYIPEPPPGLTPEQVQAILTRHTPFVIPPAILYADDDNKWAKNAPRNEYDGERWLSFVKPPAPPLSFGPQSVSLAGSNGDVITWVIENGLPAAFVGPTSNQLAFTFTDPRVNLYKRIRITARQVTDTGDYPLSITNYYSYMLGWASAFLVSELQGPDGMWWQPNWYAAISGYTTDDINKLTTYEANLRNTWYIYNNRLHADSTRRRVYLNVGDLVITAESFNNPNPRLSPEGFDIVNSIGGPGTYIVTYDTEMRLEPLTELNAMEQSLGFSIMHPSSWGAYRDH